MTENSTVIKSHSRNLAVTEGKEADFSWYKRSIPGLRPSPNPGYDVLRESSALGLYARLFFVYYGHSPARLTHTAPLGVLWGRGRWRAQPHCPHHPWGRGLPMCPKGAPCRRKAYGGVCDTVHGIQNFLGLSDNGI